MVRHLENGGEAATADFSTEILDWLDLQYRAAPAGIEQSEWDYAVRYARGRYERGIEHYRHLFQQLGWSGMRQGLDAGSGAGHWTLAFALENGCAIGIDKNEAFVHLANGAAHIAGLAAEVRYQLGNVEALTFPDARFDAVWSHSTLQFCDAEDAISEFSRVLEPGGQLYCGWSTTGFRLSGVRDKVLSRDRKDLQAQLGSYLAIVLHRDGVARTPWPGPHLVTVEELAAICRAFGLTSLRQPRLQDGAPEFGGIPATVDLLCVRDGDARAFRDDLLELPLATEESRQRYRELLRLGLGKLVYGVLQERGDANDAPEIRSLYAVAAMRAGRAGDVVELAERGIDPHARGLLALDRGEFSDAAEAFRNLAGDHPDRSFLLGVALLRSGASNEAVDEFEKGCGENNRPVECGFGAMLGRAETADWSELRQRMADVLRLLPQEMGASAAEIGPIADQLLHSDT